MELFQLHQKNVFPHHHPKMKQLTQDILQLHTCKRSLVKLPPPVALDAWVGQGQELLGGGRMETNGKETVKTSASITEEVQGKCCSPADSIYASLPAWSTEGGIQADHPTTCAYSKLIRRLNSIKWASGGLQTWEQAAGSATRHTGVVRQGLKEGGS